MTAYIGVDGKARKVAGAYIGIDGKARKVVKAYVGVNGVAQLWWAASAGGEPVILEVEKRTSDTYVGETSNTGESFILIDIYPKTNGTVKVTYGGLTKTVTDTSGAERPNAKQVFFGTYGGVSDSVTTPTSGTLTISGDYAGFGSSSFTQTKGGTNKYWCRINSISSLGVIEIIPPWFLGHKTIDEAASITSIVLPASLKRIETQALMFDNLESVTFEDPAGWIWHGTPFGEDGEKSEPETWSDPASNAKTLKSGNSTFYWTKS